MQVARGSYIVHRGSIETPPTCVHIYIYIYLAALFCDSCTYVHVGYRVRESLLSSRFCRDDLSECLARLFGETLYYSGGLVLLTLDCWDIGSCWMGELYNGNIDAVDFI